MKEHSKVEMRYYIWQKKRRYVKWEKQDTVYRDEKSWILRNGIGSRRDDII